MDMFEPIAIVGQSILLPGAHNPEQLWSAVEAGKSLIQPVPATRWGVSPEHVLGPPHPDHARTSLGGYVDGFDEGFQKELHEDPFGVDSEIVSPLDPLFHWVLHTSREALREAGGGEGQRVGAILGNLSFPSEGMSRWAESIWLRTHNANLLGGRAEELLKRTKPQRLDLQMSGGPIRMLREALGIRGPTFALDAACASSLYAIKLAIDRLHDRTADLMIAGAVNRADDLFIHVGFSALQALSPTGQSRPFHRDADGLLPAEGAVVFALKRLKDAHNAGDKVHGVIMGLGLSNDGRARNLLAPASEGQVEALRRAYANSLVDPEDVGLIEAHATGTPVGDRTEVETLAQVFTQQTGLPLGSLKSNLGHLITAAGGAGLVKVLGAFKHQQLPPTLHADPSIPELASSPLRLVSACEAWQSDRPRVAAINAFGFGGNNAHLIVQEDTGPASFPLPAPTPRPAARLAVVGMGGLVGSLPDLNAFCDALHTGGTALHNGQAAMETITLPLRSLRSPPRDLKEALGQQTALLRASIDAIHDAPSFDAANAQVVVAAQADPEVARYGLRWRLSEWLEIWSKAGTEALEEDWIERAKDAAAAPLTAAGVVGRMPNIPANRINAHLNVKGASFTVASEAHSSLYALQVAARALASHEADTVILGASDLRCEPVSLATREGDAPPPGDAALAVVLMRASDAIAQKVPVYAWLEPNPGDVHASPVIGPQGLDLRHRFGDAHAASSLLDLVAAVVSVQQGLSPQAQSVPSVPLATASHDGLAFGILSSDEPDLCWQVAAAEGGLNRTQSPQTVNAGTVHLTLPAHPSPLVLPPLPGDPERMAPAPRLALWPAEETAGRTGFEEDPLPWRPFAQKTEDTRQSPRPPVPVRAPLTTSTPAPAASPSGAQAAQTVARAVQGIRVAHQAWMAQQHSLHQQFLGLRSLTLGQLQQSARPSADERRRPRRLERSQFQPAVQPAPRPAHPSAPPKAPEVPEASELPGPRFSREQLEFLSHGRVADVFGESFAPLDGFQRVVRMPEPPLLLADRVVGLDAEPNSMGRGTIWTETDVVADAWYMHDDRMPAGIMIESGQADLLLISYLGVDAFNQGERVYRLLGCTLTYHGGLPRPGETLRYDIHVDAHAQQGPIRLFFFHYDCHSAEGRRLSVREGQAGFFTDQDLADSGGVLWDPSEHPPEPLLQVDPPVVTCRRSQFDPTQVLAFAEGDGLKAFGPGFERLANHVLPPRISAPPMLFWDRVTHFEPQGGPWQRGYLRATQAIAPDDWFFEGHFNSDPCMPGTLMFEGCLQALSFYMAAYGLTLDHDGSSFEPVPEMPYDLKCRGQVTPDSKELIYEIFIKSCHNTETPTVFADFLCTVDGLKAFHAHRVGIQLTPGTPLKRLVRTLPPVDDTARVARPEGLPLDHASLLSCAWGKPSAAFGPRFVQYDQGAHVARLPGPPYHFMSRVESVSGYRGRVEPGTTIELAYDIPPEAWYFDTQGQRKMPFCVLLEAALQPCGWIAVYVGSTLDHEQPLFFRNLDGTGTVLAEIPEDAGTLKTRATLTKVHHAGGMILESFEVTCSVDDQPVYTLETTFGFFPAQALEQQVGIPPTEEESEALEVIDPQPIELTTQPERYFDGSLRLPDPMLRMIDRVTHVDLEGGKAGMGRVIATKTVDPSEWFFKAHFYSDPVQPGSLGIEAMIQTLQFYAIHAGLQGESGTPRFEAIAVNQPLSWRYRGQVVPSSQMVTVELDVTNVEEDPRGTRVVGDAWLWVDGRRIYGAEGLAIRIIKDGSSVPSTARLPSLHEEHPLWLEDHAPTFVRPVAPASWMLDQLASVAAQGSPSRHVSGLRSVTLHRWLPIDQAMPLQTQARWIDGDTMAVRLEGLSKSEGWLPIAEGFVDLTDVMPHAPQAPPTATNTTLVEAPYTSGHLPHGPRLQLLTRLSHGPRGSSAQVDASLDPTPGATLSPGLVDAMAQAVPHTALHKWFPDVSEGTVGYPGKVQHLRLFGPLPTTGQHRIEVRPVDASSGHGSPTVRISLVVDQRVRAEMLLTLVLVPGGPLGEASPGLRARFMQARRHADGLGLSRTLPSGVTELDEATLLQQDWLPGTVGQCYGVGLGELDIREIAERDHAARMLRTHPSRLVRQAEAWMGTQQPFARIAMDVSREASLVQVRTTRHEPIAVAPLNEWWMERVGQAKGTLIDIHLALVRKFVQKAWVASQDDLDAIGDRPVIWVANHQTAIESITFGMLAGPLFGGFPCALAKREHQDSWLGRWLAHGWSGEDEAHHGVLAYLDREDPTALPHVLDERLAQASPRVLIHVEGTRETSSRHVVSNISSAVLEAAIRHDAVLVPVRFSGGLPTEPVSERLDFPFEMSAQKIFIGTPLSPQAFASTNLAESKALVCHAIASVGDPDAHEAPLMGDPVFGTRVNAWRESTGASHAHAVMLECLRDMPEVCPSSARVLDALSDGVLSLRDTPEDRYLEGIARPLFGPKGPKITIG